MKACCKEYMAEQFGDDADIIADIYGEYVTSVGEKIAETHSALAAKDWGLLDRIAHTIKGNALAVGDNDMAETAIALRKTSTLNDEAGSAELIAKLEEFRTLL